MPRDLVTYCYLASSVAFAILTILLMIGWRGSKPAKTLIAASAGTMVWGLIHALNASLYPLGSVVTTFAEAERILLWLLFLTSIPFQQQGQSPLEPSSNASERRYSPLLLSLSLAALAVVASAGYLPAGFDFAALLMLAIITLHYIEHIYRNSEGGQRWAIKFLAIAVTSWFIFDFMMYAEALLFSNLDPSWWAARAVVVAITTPLIAVSAARNREWRIDISVSRSVVFHTASLFATGIYLIAAGVAGFYVRRYGGTWGSVAATALISIALIVLCMFLVSSQFRAETRVFISKNFFNYQYDYRKEWLRFTEQITPVHGTTDDSARLIDHVLLALCNLVDSPSGQIWLKRDQEYRCHGPQGAQQTALSETEPLLHVLAQNGYIADVQAMRASPQRYSLNALPYWLVSAPKAWAVLPLLNGPTMIGFVILDQPLSRLTLNWEVRDILKVASMQAAAALGQMLALEQLLQARQFEAFNRMSAFVVHDLKNLVAQLSLMLANAEKHWNNPEFQSDMLETVQNVAQRMRGLLMQLRAGTKPIETTRPLDLVKVTQGAIDAKRGLLPTPQFSPPPPDSTFWVHAHQDRLERVIGHLLQNACEACGKNGAVDMVIQRRKSELVLEVRDNGPGMSEEFISTRLFKPFESTKAHGMGIGVFESREYIRELGGQLLVRSTVGVGSVFSIILPLSDIYSQTHSQSAMQETS